MQVQGGREKPCVFVSHRLSDQAIRWELMELFAFVFCVKNLSPYLLGKLFTDHKNLVYLNSTFPKLARWMVLLSEFRFQIEHIPRAQNVVADELTRIFQLDYEKFSEKINCFKEDTTQRIFRMDEDMKILRIVTKKVTN